MTRPILFLTLTLMTAIFSSCAPPGRVPLLLPENGGAIRAIELILAPPVLIVGEERQAMVLVLLASGDRYRLDSREAEWSCGDELVAVVDENGMVGGRSPGSAEIEARWQDRSARLALVVQPPRDQSSLRINEVYYDAPGSDEGREFIEIVNRGPLAVALDGLSLADGAHGNKPYRFAPGLVLEARACMVVASSREGFMAIFNREPELAGLGFTLNNDGETVVLSDEAGRVIDTVYIRGGTEDRPAPAEWASARLPSAEAGQSIKRLAGADTASCYDWIAGAPDPGTP